jgi:hypothetical protein
MREWSGKPSSAWASGSYACEGFQPSSENRKFDQMIAETQRGRAKYFGKIGFQTLPFGLQLSVLLCQSIEIALQPLVFLFQPALLTGLMLPVGLELPALVFKSGNVAVQPCMFFAELLIALPLAKLLNLELFMLIADLCMFGY